MRVAQSTRSCSAVLALAALASLARASPRDVLSSDIPADFKPPTAANDYLKREAMIPMRDGIKLHAVIVVPKGASRAPILLDRTPYDADAITHKADSPHLAAILPRALGELATAGYIIAVEDVRGKHGSQGIYVNERPLRGPLNSGPIDHATDAYDTIEWLIRHTPQSNGKVGMIGVSYDGMMVLMALSDPHPALKAAVPINPVVDTWLNDDDFHGGAFRLIGYDYYYEQDSERGEGDSLPRGALDDYEVYLSAGSAWDFAKANGVDQLPYPARMARHPAYDDFWREQALEIVLPRHSLTVPTLYVASQWDQEDMFGAVGAYEATSRSDPAHKRDFLVLGPWSHGGSMGEGDHLGPFRFDDDTAAWFRRTILLPFLDARLKDGAPSFDPAPVTAFETGANRWRAYSGWPPPCPAGCAGVPRLLWLHADGSASFDPPEAAVHLADYVSDPAKPVPYRHRPIRPTYAKDSTWGQWLVDDQREFTSRPDVVSWTSPPLKAALRVVGAPRARLRAVTDATDADFVVKLIDVQPPEVPSQPELGGYELMVAADILRGRYRGGFGRPAPIRPGLPQSYDFTLPNVDHVFLPGHRIMVQVQSSWFPLYDRNPQTFIDNIFFAKPGDYRQATIGIIDGGAESSSIELPAAR